jgi:hypothetical protein
LGLVFGIWVQRPVKPVVNGNIRVIGVVVVIDVCFATLPFVTPIAATQI